MVDPDAFQTWLDAYSRAVEARNADQLAKVFSVSAHFLKTPFDRALEGRDAICREYEASWSRLERGVFEIKRIGDGWAHWSQGGTIIALDEPWRADGILKAELNEAGLCTRLTLWTETLSVREADMLAQRDA
ncbi:hypothetical protein HY29_12110 [Hyphomonas beringensis]|uniref:SnoaL-like domain-containing protein n=1 Tax=Hyphomonas beringensis TaxID=1280946 RepID=A0A062UH52_9PROT|nr:nuclear transport factor 2 family protein [Hyphomonas beringensis]KCZ55460.1 hypothetical protein HY29_12110 [Hyphomonas beringensis]